MCARLTSLLLATAWIAGVGCASKPAEEPSAAVSMDRACASSAASQAIDHDPDIDSILTQPTSDRRLAQINRRMYQSLRTLDAELRREERLAACEQQPFGNATLQAQLTEQAGARGGAPTAEGNAVNAPIPVSGAASAAAARTISTRKASLPANAGSGNGATAPRMVPGSDNDIVARRLRKAAEQETNPTLRAKLWKEYTDYRLGTSAK